MEKITMTVTAASGIHARPAGAIVKKAGEFSSTIKIEKAGKEADAKRLLAILSLGVKKDDEITIIADGADEKEAVAAVKQIVEEAH